MEQGSAEGPERQDDLHALTARVAELERQVAELRHETVAIAATPTPRSPPPLQVESLPPPPPEEPVHTPAISFEDRLGTQIFPVLGILALMVAMAYFLKLAIEHGYIGPVARLLIGLVAGTGVVLWSEMFRRKGMKAFSYALKAVGSGVLYLSLWASFQLYHLLPANVALVAMVLVTAWNAFMAWSQDAELLAAYALAGGFATPLLLSTGGDHETFLFTYIGAIDLAAVLLIRWKPWRRLLVPSFVATAGFFIGWYAHFFHVLAQPTWDGQSTETALFTALFFAIFALVSLKGWTTYAEDMGKASEVIGSVLIPLISAAFIGLALYSIFEDSGLHTDLAWLMVALAAVLLALLRFQATPVARAMQLASAVIFLTIAIPLKASGHTMTIAWLVEGLILYWASTRFEQEHGAPAKVLRVLSAGGYVLGLLSLVSHWWWFGGTEQGFFNAGLGAAMVAVAALSGATVLAFGQGHDAEQVAPTTLIAIDLVAVLLTLREVASGWSAKPHAAFANPDFATSIVGLIVLAGVTAWAYRLRHEVIAAWTSVVLHLLLILTVEREIGALWTRSEANLQRSLAISGFLMIYGGLLLAAGFWRRNAFVRWEALVLLIFTICKVFLYDMSGLSGVYRVVSLLGLGALLMSVSFAYQKDWLGLKATGGGSK
jgi:uncharacterized membrane protein